MLMRIGYCPEHHPIEDSYFFLQAKTSWRITKEDDRFPKYIFFSLFLSFISFFLFSIASNIYISYLILKGKQS